MLLESTFGEVEWAECESVIRRFEDAWRERLSPDIGDYLRSDTPHSVRLLIELVHIDLEFRLRTGDYARVEDYLWRFTELSDPVLIRDLIVAEFTLRNRHSPPAWPEEYFLRFPDHMAILRARLTVDAGTGWFAATRLAELPGAPLAGPPIISGYEIQGELGRGGMGIVYQARDLLLHRTVAVKTFATVPRPDSCARFAREAEAIARLDHPHIVPVYEVGEWHAPNGGPSVPFFVMKLYTGGSMGEVPVGPGTEVRTHASRVETIARAVHHAHQRGVLHRDLKPSNILLDNEGRPHVADFGLAGRVQPEMATITEVVGTPAYMAPEQARSPKQVSTAADVYGIGAILYHQLTGHAPFAAETPLATLDLVANAAPGRPSTVNPGVPRDLDTICLKCLEKEPSRRYASAAEVADDLQRWRKGLPIAARPAPLWELAWRTIRRYPLVAGLIFTTLATLIATIIILSENNARIRAKERETSLALGRECATRNQLEDSLLREQRALYLERVSSAGRFYAANQLVEAWAQLDQCPEQSRGWEWRYLNSLRRNNDVVFAGHGHNITKIGFLPNGRMVSADAHGDVRVWDVRGRQPLNSFSSGDLPVDALSVHPTKNWVAVAVLGRVSVWNVETEKMVGLFDGSSWAAFSPDGKLLLHSDSDLIRMWKVPENEPQASDEKHLPAWESAGQLAGHKLPAIAGVFTRDSKRLITSSQDWTIRKWDLTTQKQISSRASVGMVTGLALLSQEGLLAEAHLSSVIFTDVENGEARGRVEHTIGENPVIAKVQDDQTIAISGPNGEVLLWDALRHETKRVLRGNSGRIAALTLGPGSRLAAGGSERTLRVWDLRYESGFRTLAMPDGEGLAISPDAQFIAMRKITGNPPVIDDHVEHKTLLLDTAGGWEKQSFVGGREFAFHPTTGRPVTAKIGGGAIMWDPETGKEIWNKPFSAPRQAQPVAPAGRRMALSPDGELVALWDPRAGGIQLWNAADGASLGVIDTENVVVTAIAFAPDSIRLAVATPENVTIWNARSRTRQAWGDISGGVSPIGAAGLAFSPNGQWLAAISPDRSIHLLEVATGREVRRFVSTALQANDVCFSADSTRLVTGGADRTVRIWDVDTGRELLVLPGGSEPITGVAWDAVNDRIFAVDSTVRVWGTK